MLPAKLVRHHKEEAQLHRALSRFSLYGSVLWGVDQKFGLVQRRVRARLTAMQGELALVATPIGNLGDITFRAVNTLKNASRIYAEDTRRTRVLLSHLGLEGKRLLSLHAHSPERDVRTVVELLTEGALVALVTDAGMPGISDPGSTLVRAAREAGVKVTVIPGPSAVTSAVALSGLVDGPFAFLGFLPRKGPKRRQALADVGTSPIPCVFFESPHRMNETLGDLRDACGPDRLVAVCRELTKKFEETLVLPLNQLNNEELRERWQGELTLVVDKGSPGAKSEEAIDVEARGRSLLAQGTSLKDAASLLSKELAKEGTKTSRRELYSQLLAWSKADNHPPEPSES